MIFGRNKSSSPAPLSMSSGTAASSSAAEFCLSGPACHNPKPALKPTRLATDDTISAATGVCSYCRNAGVETHLTKDLRGVASSLLMAPPEEVEEVSGPPAAFDKSEYENFDPDAYDKGQHVPVSADAAKDIEESDDFMASLKGSGTPPLPASKEATALSELTSEDLSFVPPSPPLPTLLPDAPRVAPVTVEAFAVGGDAVSKNRKPRTQKKKKAPESQPMPPEPLSFGESSLPEPLAAAPLPPAPAVAAPSPARSAPLPSLAEREATAPKTRMEKLLEKMPPRPRAVTVFAGAQTSSASGPAATNGANDGFYGDSRPQQKLAVSTRLVACLKETGYGLMDVGVSAFCLTMGPIGLGLGLAAMAIRVPLSLITLHFRGVVKAIGSGFKTSAKMVMLTLHPFTSLRAIPAVSLIAAGAGVALSTAISPVAATALLVAGVGGSAGWVIWRGARGFITGTQFDAPVKQYAPSWIKTEGLNSKEIAQLNDEFERTVSTAFTHIGFRAKLNGTQQARDNGHVGSGDGGVDVFLKDSEGKLSVVSCKRYKDPVGVKEVREIFAVSQSKTFAGARPVLVTTVEFTEPAILFAKENGVALWTIDELMHQARKMRA